MKNFEKQTALHERAAQQLSFEQWHIQISFAERKVGVKHDFESESVQDHTTPISNHRNSYNLLWLSRNLRAKEASRAFTKTLIKNCLFLAQ